MGVEVGVGGNNGIMRRDKFIWYRMYYICGHYSSLQKQKSNLNPVIIEATDVENRCQTPGLTASA